MLAVRCKRHNSTRAPAHHPHHPHHSTRRPAPARSQQHRSAARSARCRHAMAAEVDRGRYRWWRLFQRLPAYVTLVAPEKKALNLKRAGTHRLQIIELDDSFDDSALEEGRQPATFEVRPGSILLALPDDADSADKQSVTPPWPCRVDALWLVAGDKPPSLSGTSAEAQAWERQQLKRGRVAAALCQVDITFFYRLHDLVLDGCGDAAAADANRDALAASLTALGIAPSQAAALKLIQQHRGGTNETARQLSRYLVFSTHQAKLQQDEDGAGDEDEDEEGEALFDAPTPLEAVMAPAEVMFLGDDQEGLPLGYAPASAGVVGASTGQLQLAGVADSTRAALQDQQRQHQVAHGFWCNLILVKQTNQLFSLQGWADGTAGRGIKGAWVKPSRRLAKQLLRETKVKLAGLQRAFQLQQQQERQEAAAAAAGAGGGGGGGAQQARGDGNRQQQPQPLHRLRSDVSELQQEQRGQRRRPRSPDARPAADSPAAGASHKRRHVVGLAGLGADEDNSDDDEDGAGAANDEQPPACGGAAAADGDDGDQQQAQDGRDGGGSGDQGGEEKRNGDAAMTPVPRAGSARTFAEAAMRTGKAVLSRLAGGATTAEKRRPA